MTPDPHLREPVTADQIFRVLAVAKLGIIANNASPGGNNADIVKIINADIASWPLRIVEYKTAAALQGDLEWTSGDVPGGNEAPYAFAALNILIQYGPIGTPKPSAPDSSRQQAATKILAALDPLLWPVRQLSVVAIPSRTAEPSATPAPPSASPKPAKTPKPSKKP